MAMHVTADSASTRHSLQVRFDAFERDEANARLLRDGRAVPLPPTPFALLCALVRQSRSLLTKQALLDEVWSHQFLTESALKTAISDLRARTGNASSSTAKASLICPFWRRSRPCAGAIRGR